jgi:hypothetical protein
LDVLIFSDKGIKWSSGADVKVAWPRWYRKAIAKSAAQINGAAHTLRDHPDQLFLEGQEPDPSEMERGLRSMALEPRLSRRLLGSSVVDAMKTAEDKKADRFARNIVPGAHSADEKVGYVFLVLAHHGDAPGPAYDEYRKRRRVMLRGYCLNMLQSHRNLKRAVGIGIDASSKVTGRTGGSEDFYALEVDRWRPELNKQAEELKKDLGLLKPENVTHGTASVDEFPRAGGITLVRDPDWPNMWRLRLPNGQLTDRVNSTRAKDAARSPSRRERDG